MSFMVKTNPDALLALVIEQVPTAKRATARAFLNAAVKAKLMEETEACARIVSGMSDGMECDERGVQDLETGEIPCGAELRGDVCLCVERSDLAHKIATKIRARSID